MIIQKLIRSKLQDKLNAFFKLQKSIIQGFTIRNLEMKPDILQQFSQIIKVPLTLIKGTIQSVSINIPWQSIFYTKKNQGLSIVISGVKISAKLPNIVMKQYILGIKKKIIQKFTQQFNKKATSRFAFLNKLKQYFLGTISIQFNNIQLDFILQFKHSIVGILAVQSIKYQKNNTNQNTKFEIKNLSLAYKSVSQLRQQYIINKADLAMRGSKKQGIDVVHFQTNNLQISFSNQNFNDIRRLITLVQWHNSFINVPEKLWQYKPNIFNIFGSISTKQKVHYGSRIIEYKVKQGKRKQFLETLSLRRQYIQIFEQFRKDPGDMKVKQQLNEIQQKLQVWKVNQFRGFCLLWQKTFPNKPHSLMNKITKQRKQKKTSWLSYWFPKNQQNQIKQLQKCLQNAPKSLSKKELTFNIQLVKISLNIKSRMGNQPFLKLIALNNCLQSISTPINQDQYEKHKNIKVQKLMIEYDRYCGHHEDHKYFLNEGLVNLLDENVIPSQDQFQDIDNFLQCSISQNRTQFTVMPFRIRANEETLQKFAFFKFQKINSTFRSAQALVLQQNSLKYQIKQKTLILNTSAFITIPQNMCQKQSQQIQLALKNISYKDDTHSKFINIEQFAMSANLLIEQHDQTLRVDESIKKVQESVSQPHQYNHQVEKVEFFTTSIQVTQSQQVKCIVKPIKIQFKSMTNFKYIIRLASKLKPKSKNIKQYNKLKHIRRKQSIGQQFIDACQNLQQHMSRSKSSMYSSQKSKYVVKDKKDMKYNLYIEKVRFILQESELILTKTSVNLTQYWDHRQIKILQQKKLEIFIYNLRNFTINIKQLKNQLTRMIQLKSRSEEQQFKLKKNQVQAQANTILITNFNFYFYVYNNKKLKVKGEIENFQFSVSRNKNLNISFIFGLALYKQLKSKSINSHGQQIKQYLIQPFTFKHIHEKQYNKDQKFIKIQDVMINIKPHMFIQLGNIFDVLETPQKLRIQVVNLTANYIKISTNQNQFREYEYGQKAISQFTECQIILFGRNDRLHLNQESCLQKIRVTQHLNLLKTMKSQYVFHLQSNLRIKNSQQNIIWVRIITNKGMSQLRKTNNMYNDVFYNLNSAHVNDTKNISGLDKPVNFKRSNSFNVNMMQKFQEDDSFETQIQKFTNTKSIVKKIGNPNINSRMPRQEHNYSHTRQTSPNKIGSQKHLGLHTQSNERQSTHHGVTITQYRSRRHASQPQNNYQVFFQPIEPDQTIQLLVSSQNYYIQLIQFDKSGGILQKYESFKNNKQFIIHSYVSEQYNKQVSSTLVINSNIRNYEKQQNCFIYEVQLLSPVVMVNKIPMDINFCFSRQQLDMLQVVISAGKSIHRQQLKSQLQILQPFKIKRINNMQYKQITETQIHVRDYQKSFRLDKIVQDLKHNQQDVDIRIIDFLCMNNQKKSIQMGIQIKIFKHIMKMTIFSQFIFVNMTSLKINLQILQQNYTYPSIQIAPLRQQKNHNYKSLIKMSNSKLSQLKVLQKMFKQNQGNLSIFTGSFEEDIARSVKHGQNGSFITSKIYNTYQVLEDNKFRNKIINYGNNKTKVVIRKIPIDQKPINLIFFIPSLFIINKSDWTFYIKGSGQQLKKIEKHSTQYLLINDLVSIQACEQKQDIAYSEWMKISLSTLGIIFYAKQMTSSNGYQSREYELRKKRLKKAPKLFFKILLTKYELGHQILIQQSQYPPVSFINKCKCRVQVKQMTEQVIQQMEHNQMVEYASKIAHHTPKFSFSIVQNYQFKKFGQFSLQQSQVQKVFSNKIKVRIGEYKDKKIIVFQQFNQQNIKLESIINYQYMGMLQKQSITILSINSIQFSIMTNNNKQISCTSVKGVEIVHERKHTKKNIDIKISTIEIFSYNGMQPRYLFYSKQPTLNMSKVIRKDEVIGYIKGKLTQPQLNTSSKSNISIKQSRLDSNISNPNEPNIFSGSKQPILSLELVIDYHKHATILQKCIGRISELVIVINTNTMIDYIKHYYEDVTEFANIIKKHEMGRNLIKQIKQIFSGEQKSNQSMGSQNNINENGNSQYRSNFIQRKKSISINSLNQNYQSYSRRISYNNMNQTPTKLNKKLSQTYNNATKPGNNDDIDIIHRHFLIQNFKWNGVKVTIKFQNIQNLQYFISSKQIKQKYLLKFITWIGDLRPIQFSPTQVEYQQYTIMKLIQLIDVNKLMIGLYQTFLQYPLQEFYHIISFVTKFIGFNDLEQSNEQWNTLKRLGKSAIKFGRILFSYKTPSLTYVISADGQLKESKRYVEQFREQTQDLSSIIQKIMKFKYEQWRYKYQRNQSRLNQKISRLQRYNLPNQILKYEGQKSQIQIAMNDYFGNKIFREIRLIKKINKDTIVGISQDCFVLYMMDKQEWVTVRHEQVVDIRIQRKKNVGNRSFTHNFSFRADNKSKTTNQLTIALVNQKQNNGKQFRIDKYEFSNIMVTSQQVRSINEEIRTLRLANVY